MKVKVVPTKKCLILICFVAVGSLFLLIGSTFLRSTRIEGKPLETWVHETSPKHPSKVQEKAKEILVKHGSQHLEDIIRMGLRHRNRLFPSPSEIWNGLLNSTQTVPPNISFSDREDSLHAIELIGADARYLVPELVSYLDDKDSYVRRYAGDLLGAIGPSASNAVPALVQHLFTEFHRGYLFDTVTRIGEPAVPELIPLLSNTAFNVRDTAVTALSRIGLPAVSALQNTLTNENERVRETVTNALHRLALLHQLDPDLLTSPTK